MNKTAVSLSFPKLRMIRFRRKFSLGGTLKHELEGRVSMLFFVLVNARFDRAFVCSDYHVLTI